MSSIETERPLWRFTVAKYQRMADAGIIKCGERVELLAGLLVNLPPLEEGEAIAHAAAVKHLSRRLGDLAFVAGAVSIPLGECSEPRPDIAVFSRTLLEKSKKPFDLEDIYAVLEIAGASLQRDLGPKLRIYRRGRHRGVSGRGSRRSNDRTVFAAGRRRLHDPPNLATR